MYRRKENIETRMYLLDSKLVSKILHRTINDIVDNITFLTNSNVDNDYMLVKNIINNSICNIINTTTDAACKTLTNNYDIDKFIETNADVRASLNELNMAMFSSYNSVFRFNANQIVSIDTIIAGSTLTVYAFIEEL